MFNTTLQADMPAATLADTILEIVGYAAPCGGPVTEADTIVQCVSLGHAADAVRGTIDALIEADHLSVRSHGAHRSLRLGATPVDDTPEVEDPWLCAGIVAHLASSGGWVQSQEMVDEIVDETGHDEEILFGTLLALIEAGRLITGDPLDLLDEASGICLNTLAEGISNPADMSRYGPLAWERNIDGKRAICHHLFAYDFDDAAVTGMPIEPLTPFVTRGGRVGPGWPEGPIYNDQSICLICHFDADDRLASYHIRVGPNAAGMAD